MTFEENLRYVHSVGCHSPEFFSGRTQGGYHLQQNPVEMAHLLTWLQERFPAGVEDYLEIGSASGGFIRCIHEVVGFDYGTMIDNGEYQVELQPGNIKEFQNKVFRYILDSHSPAAKEVLGHGKFDFIFVDGDHSYDGVKQDIDLVIPHADKDTIIGFHDIECPHVPGVKQAYDEAIAAGKLVEIKRWVEPANRMTFGLSVCRLP